MANLIDSAVKAFGRLDIVVNNAGVEKKITFVDYPLNELQRILDVNLIGPFLVSRNGIRRKRTPGYNESDSVSRHFIRRSSQPLQ